jgi:hypothetical protein
VHCKASLLCSYCYTLFSTHLHYALSISLPQGQDFRLLQINQQLSSPLDDVRQHAHLLPISAANHLRIHTLHSSYGTTGENATLPAGYAGFRKILPCYHPFGTGSRLTGHKEGKQQVHRESVNTSSCTQSTNTTSYSTLMQKGHSELGFHSSTGCLPRY